MLTVDEHFTGKDELRTLYDRLVALTEKFGSVEQDPKKTSIHLNRRTAFAGVAVRKEHLVLTIKSDRPIDSPASPGPIRPPPSGSTTRSSSPRSRIWIRSCGAG